MSRIKKSLIVAGATLAVGTSVLGGIGAVSAASNTNGPDTLVEKIASKFNLNKDEVKAVFDENRTEMEASRKARIEEKLTQAVTDGKITEDQKAKIIAKAEELKTRRDAERDSMKDKTDEERKALMEQHRTELEKWATDNGIPAEYLRFAGPGGGHGHRGMDRPGPDAGAKSSSAAQ